MEKIKLGDLCKPSGRQIKEDKDTLIDYIDISAVDNETKKVTGYQTITFGESPSRARKAVKCGNILVSTVRPNLNAVALLEKDTPNVSVASTGFCVLESKDDVDPRFIFNFCKSKPFIDDMVSQATGASYPAVSDKIVRSALIPKYSYQEQQHISNVLDKLAGIIDGRRIELQKLDYLIKARFVELFGDENNSMGWDTVNIEDVADVQVGVVIKPAQYYTDESNGIKAFRSLNIGAGYIKDNDWVYFSPEGHKKNSKSILKEDDLLIVRSGAPGTACVVPKEYEGCNAIDIIIAHPDTKKVNPHYLCAFTNMPHGKKQIEEGTGGAAQQHFNVGKYNKMKLMLPPTDKQLEYVDFVKQTDKSKVAVQKALDETQTLFDSLMQEYFG